MKGGGTYVPGKAPGPGEDLDRKGPTAKGGLSAAGVPGDNRSVRLI